MNEADKPVYGNFSSLVVDKKDLINALKENREKHNSIYNICVSGYYEQVENAYEKWAAQLDKEEKKLKKFSELIDKGIPKITFGKSVEAPSAPAIHTNYIFPSFPTSYEDSYNAAIKRVELSIYDTFNLTEQEFQQYILNNWSWKNSFVNYSSSILYSSTGCYITPYASGLVMNF